MNKILNKIRYWSSQSVIWPPIDAELTHARSLGLLRGYVLNAGAGTREIGHLIDGTLVNQDIRWPDESREHIHIYSPLSNIPRAEATFDTIVCIAVLEHVESPHAVLAEFYRVLKPGGYVIASVPFLQPEHKIPTDFQRYTLDGLRLLFAHSGFDVIEVITLFSPYHTLHWILYEILSDLPTSVSKIMRYSLLPIIALLAQRSKAKNSRVASAFQIIVQKPELPTTKL